MIQNWSQETYIKAYKFAAQAHQGQKIPGSEIPYIMHLSFVSMEVIAALNENKEYDGNLAIQCAILHDTIEDTNITYEQIKTEFGAAVANGVLALTKDKSLDKHLQMADSLQRIQQQPQEIWMVKLADRISNLQPPPYYWTREKITKYREEAIQIHDALKDASNFLASRLANKIENYQSFTTHPTNDK
ncbi:MULTISPECIES: HD domain-containing protein [Calothrix]|uniref:Bifunctional (P)ppGpp synthetase/guanosine-3',5'-bis(Diphosphate) 3'-pyrophosphohydrolase n=2 Tax=Calothrix TaxID=1186 RepID=A0ABR8A7G9_9CYAN|nr:MULTISPECIES: HD domain-containing protein [Calothrix]MBD2195218.1 bifunctional (p)ppGpp synthetase/guanosine-3',5'-bis(diphosphate) 3'-pyrophosphohydrolase [Calothrix parietina FACHB-288]MBD2223811.1 bifunctional (p)ppGpp synthetase/guanosine-3',5'-bis(diphosphate) 3'-pyrophosphohydrolase [Calothrix anomala FACHB-343]